MNSSLPTSHLASLLPISVNPRSKKPPTQESPLSPTLTGRRRRWCRQGRRLQGHRRVVVVHIRLFEFGRTAADATLAAHDTGRRQQEQRGRNQQQDAEAGKDSDDLGPVPHDRGARVAEFVLAGALVVVAQEEVVLERDSFFFQCQKCHSKQVKNTHIQAGQAVPAEDVLAPFAHHLGTTFVLFDRHGAHRTALDEIIVERDAVAVGLTVRGQPARIFLTRHRRMPLEKKGKSSV